MYLDSVFLRLTNPYKNIANKFQIAHYSGLKRGDGWGSLSFTNIFLYRAKKKKKIKLQNPNTEHNPFNETHSIEQIRKALPVNLTANFYQGGLERAPVFKGSEV